MKKGFYLFGTIKMLSYFFLSSRNLVLVRFVHLNLFLLALLNSSMDQELAEGYRWQFRKNLKYFSVSYVSILWSIWTYRNMETVMGDPYPATSGHVW